MSTPLTLADGQVAATATALFTASTGFDAPSGFTGGRVKAYLANTSASLTETVTITFQRNGGTARRIERFVLAPNETAKFIVPMQQGDILLGATSDAATVDYLVTLALPGDTAGVLDSSGATRQVNTGVSGAQTISGNLISQALLQVSTDASVAAAGTNSGNAGVFAAGKVVHPTSAADGTKGVRVATADDVAGVLLIVENHVAGVLKIYPPSGGAFNGGSADAAFSTTSAKGAMLYCTSTGVWLAMGLG